MSGAARSRRLRLFEQIAKDLGEQIVGKGGLVLCPLCLREFGRKSAEQSPEIPETDWLTEEHVIPQSAKGKEVTLTCKTCNNAAGSEIDSHIAQKLRLDRGFKGKGKIKAQLAMAGVGARADITIGAGHMGIEAKSSTAYVHQKLIEATSDLARRNEPLTIKIAYSLNKQKLAAAIVKAAYLGLFADLGYRYILMPSLDQVRRAIRFDGPDRQRALEIVIPCEVTEFTNLPAMPSRLTFEAIFPGGVPARLSMINLGDASGAAFVLLPPATDVNTGTWDGLARVAESFSGKSELRFEFNEGVVLVHGLT
jgi:ribosome-associated translation inhibitor RaiA